MAEIVSSALVQETVGQVLSGVLHKYEGKEKTDGIGNLERLEMAQIKLEAALETSDRWLITDVSLLRWHKKLRRAAHECNDTLHKYKQRILEEKQTEQEVRNSSFHKQIAHATKSFLFSSFSRRNDELTRSIIRRFEWFADGASEFLRFIELGGTPRRHMTFDPLIRHLLSGKKLQHKIDQGNECPLFLLWVPFRTTEYGIEASLIFIRKDSNALEGNFYLSVMLQLSESTDIVGITIKCLQLFAPHFRSTVEIIRKELTQLPTQELSWMPYVDSCQKEHWDNVLGVGTRWFRPDPLCCKQHDKHASRRISNLNMTGLPDDSLEPIIEVNLKCQVSLSEYNKRRTSTSESKVFLQDSPNLKVGLLFTPHGSSEDLLPADKNSAIAAIDGEDQHCLQTDITLEQVEEIMLPKAVNYFCQNAEATVHQMLWKSKHGAAYIQVEKESTRATLGGGRKRKLMRPQEQDMGSQSNVISQFLSLWVAHAPIQLQGSILDWIQKEKESQLAAPPMHLKF